MGTHANKRWESVPGTHLPGYSETSSQVRRRSVLIGARKGSSEKQREAAPAAQVWPEVCAGVVAGGGTGRGHREGADTGFGELRARELLFRGSQE